MILTTIPRTREIFLNEITTSPEFDNVSLILTPHKTLVNGLTEVIVSISIKPKELWQFQQQE